MTTFYEILRVEQNVSSVMLKDAYQSLLQKIKDQNLLNQIEEAYFVLGNADKRAMYDQELHLVTLENAAKLREEAKAASLISDNVITQTNSEKNSMSYKDLLLPFIGKWAGVNIDNPTKLQHAKLIGVETDFFTVKYNSILYHYPYNQILKITTTVNGSNITNGIIVGIEAALFIEVFHLVVYKGATMFGVSIPVGGSYTE